MKSTSMACARAGIAALALGLIGQAGCYHYRVRAPRPDPATEYRSKTAFSFLWGALQPDIRADGCEVPNAVDEVRVTTNLVFGLVMVGTAGIVSPMKVEWRCAKQPLEEPPSATGGMSGAARGEGREDARKGSGSGRVESDRKRVQK